MKNPNTQLQDFSTEIEEAFKNYAFAVVVGRAIPDARDGLKPVHRRILYAMHDGGYTMDKPFRKSARIVGDVMGKYHPHGDSAIYESMVRMVQPFSMSLPVVFGQGNFGSIDNDPAAAMRYTEAKLNRAGEAALKDIDENCVDFEPTYDGLLQEPSVLPTRLPLLLINGSEGIAVGLATKIPPHSTKEVCEAVIALVKQKNITDEELIKIIPGPDFPTGALVASEKARLEWFKTGAASFQLRSKYHLEEIGKRQAIIIDEIPYQVIKSSLVEEIVAFVKEKNLDVHEVSDESSKGGIRIVIELKNGADPEMIIQNIFSKTKAQISYSSRLIAIDQGSPKQFNVRGALNIFIDFRRDVITRRTLNRLKKIRASAELLLGRIFASQKTDEIISAIKSSKDKQESILKIKEISFENTPETIELAKKLDMDTEKNTLTQRQAEEIATLQLYKLSMNEKTAWFEQAKKDAQTIDELIKILTDKNVLDNIIISETEEMINLFGHNRRSEMVPSFSFDEEDFITEEEVILTLSNDGWAKKISLDSIPVQARGGMGLKHEILRASDEPISMLSCSSKDKILIFTKENKVYSSRAWKFPSALTSSKGRPLLNFVKIEKETPYFISKAPDTHEDLIMCFSNGLVRRNSGQLYQRIQSNGVYCAPDDFDMAAVVCAGTEDDLVLLSKFGRIARLAIEDIRSTKSRSGKGVIRFRLKEGDSIIAACSIKKGEEGFITMATLDGQSKRIKTELLRRFKAGSKGQNVALKEGEELADMVFSHIDQELLALSKKGRFIRVDIDTIRSTNKRGVGVKLFRLNEDDQLKHLFAVSDSDGYKHEIEENMDNDLIISSTTLDMETE